MAKRGRQSAAAAEVTVIEGGLNHKPKPPSELTKRQREIWEETVASEPTEWFCTGATKSMLADYCRHKEEVEKISEVINDFQSNWLKTEKGSKRYAQLLRMRESETRAASSLAGKLRLTNQSRYNAKNASTATQNSTAGSAVWEF